ncbi:hypothetical protein G7046_g9775 [Stylonectria norvegica]|nr:hypothetical protein G7046_g9775 [Stylonectria norvegica]
MHPKATSAPYAEYAAIVVCHPAFAVLVRDEHVTDMWVNASTRDIEMHDHLVDTASGISVFRASNTKYKGNTTVVQRKAPTRPPLPVSINWVPFELNSNQMGLFQYFENVAVSSLATFGNDQIQLRDLLVQMAFSENTPSSNAILKAMLALSSLHRDGHQNQAAELKIGALQSMAASAKTINGDMTRKRAMQHVAAGMLLCSFEVSVHFGPVSKVDRVPYWPPQIQKPTETYGDWLFYGCGVKYIIQVASILNSTADDDAVLLLCWAHYHDVMARFSIRHWQKLFKSCTQPTKYRSKVDYIVCADNKEVPHPSSPGHEILHVLYKVCDMVVEPSHPTFYSKSYRDEVNSLKGKLIDMEFSYSESTNSSPPTPRAAAMKIISELHRLAILTYLERALGDVNPKSPNINELTKKALVLLAEIGHCRWLFPLLIFGSEARSDDDRALILNVMTRTEKETRGRSLDSIRTIIESIWVQDDLADGELVYMDKLRAILSSAAEVPALA